MNELKNIFMRWVFLLPIAYCIYDYYGQYEIHLTEIDALNRATITENNKLKKQIAELKSIQKYKQDEEKSKKLVETINKKIKETQKQLPIDSNNTKILSYFKKELKQINVRNINFQVGEVITTESHNIKKFTITGMGTYLQSLIFIERLNSKESTERIMNVLSLDIKVNSSAQRSRFQMVKFAIKVETYSQNPKG